MSLTFLKENSKNVFEKLLELNYFSHSVSDIISRFQNAWNKDPKLAIKTVVNLRYNYGEKLVFQIICLYLKETEPLLYYHILQEIPQIGTWKDVLQICKLKYYYDDDYVYGYEIKDEVKLFAKNLMTTSNSNINNQAICAKWAPSENSHYDKLLGFAKYLMKELKMTPKQYRQSLTRQRKQLYLIETALSQKHDLKSDPPIISREAFNKYKKRLSCTNLLFTRNRNHSLKEIHNSVDKINSHISFPRPHIFDVDIVRRIENACAK